MLKQRHWEPALKTSKFNYTFHFTTHALHSLPLRPRIKLTLGLSETSSLRWHIKFTKITLSIIPASASFYTLGEQINNRAHMTRSWAYTYYIHTILLVVLGLQLGGDWDKLFQHGYVHLTSRFLLLILLLLPHRCALRLLGPASTGNTFNIAMTPLHLQQSCDNVQVITNTMSS